MDPARAVHTGQAQALTAHDMGNEPGPASRSGKPGRFLCPS
jgi:hypothetical protein